MLSVIARTFVCLLVVAGLTHPAAAKRVALVIGNGAYEQATPLKNPKNDADALAAVLKRLDFEVIKGIDLNRADFERMVRKFSRAIRGADAALLFYAGHGLQVEGRNYLAPVDASLADEADLEFETLRLETVLAQMERETRVNLVFLDACRDNPLARNLARSMGTRSASVGRGLARVDTGVGTLIAFATEPGNVALDGAGANSPFTEALLKHIETPDLDIARLMRRVRKEVLDKTSGRQVPWSNSSLTGDFVFASRQITVEAKPDTNERPVTPAPAPTVDNRSVELAFWDSIKDSDDVADYRGYLRRFPDGVFIGIAKRRMERLEREKQARLKVPVEPKKVAPPAPKAEPTLDDGIAFYQSGDYGKALDIFRRHADQGDRHGLHNVGHMYANGFGVDKDLREAARWFERAGHKGHVEAMVLLADLYAVDGLPKNYAKAATWYLKAAEAGHKDAMNNIGLLYARGQGVRKSKTEAALWFREGAEAGSAGAMYNYGALLEDGDGVRKNDREAAHWIFKAIKGGNTFARTTMTGNISPFSIPFRREMQRLLKAEGVYDGAIDGKFGPGTRRAIDALAAR